MSKISIVIPVYNVEKYLRQCLDSIVNQTLRDIQIICVNDGSTDGSLAILQEFAGRDSRIEIIDKPNGGLSSARNAAFPLIRGKYTLFVDSDDWINSETCEKTFYHAEQTGADFVLFFNVQFDHSTGKQLHTSMCDLPLIINSYEQKQVMFQIASISAWDKLWSTRFLKTHKILFKEGLICEDQPFVWKAVMLAEKIAVFPKVLYHYRQRTSSITTSYGRKPLDLLKIFDIIKADIMSLELEREYYNSFLRYKIRGCRNLSQLTTWDIPKSEVMRAIKESLYQDKEAIESTKFGTRYLDNFVRELKGDVYAKMCFCLRNVNFYLRALIRPVESLIRIFKGQHKEKSHLESHINQLCDYVSRQNEEICELRKKLECYHEESYHKKNHFACSAIKGIETKQ